MCVVEDIISALSQVILGAYLYDEKRVIAVFSFAIRVKPEPPAELSDNQFLIIP